MRIITGMHRSGTSLVARLAHGAGADLGDPDTFYRPDQWNSDGYFEQPEFHSINMPLINGPFGKLAYFHLPSTGTILKRATRFSGPIRETAAKYDECVVKETRFCLTLPAWHEHGASFDRILVCLRNPLMVARSLRRRNKIPLSLGFKLWQLHNERLLENAQSIPLHFLSYEALLDKGMYLREIQAALAFIGIPLTDPQVTKLCDDKIRFGAALSEEGVDGFPASVRSLWKELLDRHQAQIYRPLVNNTPSPIEG